MVVEALDTQGPQTCVDNRWDVLIVMSTDSRSFLLYLFKSVCKNCRYFSVLQSVPSDQMFDLSGLLLYMRFEGGQ